MPWPSAWPNAPSTRSATREEVSTLPAATAAGGRALSRQPSGAVHRERAVGALARRHVGVGQHAQREDAGRQGHRQRAVEVALVLVRRVPVKSSSSASPRTVARRRSSRSPSRASSTSARLALAVLELCDARAGAALGVVQRLLEAARARSARPEPLGQRRAAAPRRRGWRPAGRAGPPRAGAGCACARSRSASSVAVQLARRRPGAWAGSPRPRPPACASRPACCPARTRPRRRGGRGWRRSPPARSPRRRARSR